MDATMDLENTELSPDKISRGQVSRIRIDGISEKDQLGKGNAQHHAQGNSVPAHLNEFLGHNGPEPSQGKGASLHC